MADLLSMAQIKNTLRDRFAELGYSARVTGFTNFTFDQSFPVRRVSGAFGIRSANAKRFEIRVTASSQESFLIPARYDKDEGHWYAIKRFTKRADVLPNVLIWLSESIKSLSHIAVMLDLDTPLPGMYQFGDNTFRFQGETVYPGLIVSVEVESIVALVGRRVVGAVYNPATKPYFLVKCDSRNNYGTRQVHIITDGEGWYPAYITDGEGYRNKATIRQIITYPEVVDLMSSMGTNDKTLVHAAVNHYIEGLMKDAKTEE